MNHFSLMRRPANVLCNSGSFKKKNLLSGLKEDMFLFGDGLSMRSLVGTALSVQVSASTGWPVCPWLNVTGALDLLDIPCPFSIIDLSEQTVSELSNMSNAFWMNRSSESRLCNSCFGSQKQSESSVVSPSPTETVDHCWLSWWSAGTSRGWWFGSISLWPASPLALFLVCPSCSTISTSSCSSDLMVTSLPSCFLPSLSELSDSDGSPVGEGVLWLVNGSVLSLKLWSQKDVWAESIAGPKTNKQMCFWRALEKLITYKIHFTL